MAPWKDCLLGDIVRFGNGKSIKPGGEGIYPVYGSNGIIGGCDEFRHENGVIIGRVGAYCGSVVYCPSKFWASDNTLIAYPASESVDTNFLYYLLFDSKLSRYAGGAAQPLVTQIVLKQVAVRVPPLPIQRRIAGILSAYDELIENSQRRIKILESMARGLYREWFRSSDSDRFISADQLVNDGILEINDGYRAKNSELGDIGLPFARAGNVNNGFLFDNADILAEQYLSRVGSKRSVNGDVVFTSKGTVGRFARVRERTPEFVYSPQLCFWRVRKMEALSPNYLYRWMQSREFLDQVDCVKGSTDMADYVSLSNQRKMIVRIPCAAAQKKGDTALGPVEDLIGALDDQIQNLRRTRNLLLPRLLSGQIDLKVD